MGVIEAKQNLEEAKRSFPGERSRDYAMLCIAECLTIIADQFHRLSK